MAETQPRSSSVSQQPMAIGTTEGKEGALVIRVKRQTARCAYFKYEASPSPESEVNSSYITSQHHKHVSRKGLHSRFREVL